MIRSVIGLCWAVGSLLFAPELEAKSLSVGQVLERHIESRGGSEAILGWRSVEARGTMYRFGRSFELEWELRRDARSEIRYRGSNEHLLGVPGMFQVRLVAEGEKAWLEIEDRDAGTTQEAPIYPWLEIPLRQLADFAGPAMPSSAEARWSLVGLDVIEGEELYQLELRSGERDRELWWITTDRFELRHRRAFFERWGSERAAMVTYLDYEEVGGLRVAKTVLIDSASATIEWALDEVVILRAAAEGNPG